ncbi:MAG: RNA polymerase sigma factor [Polyangiaceae bacterium]
MKTSSNVALARLARRLLTPEEQHRADFRDLVARASRGDRNAVWAIYIAFDDEIREHARAALGPYAVDDEDVLQDFLVTLLEGRAPYLQEQGAPRKWIRRTVRVLAERHRARRDGYDDEPLSEPPETLRSPYA